jgi:hypothetical protein
MENMPKGLIGKIEEEKEEEDGEEEYYLKVGGKYPECRQCFRSFYRQFTISPQAREFWQG